MTLDKCLKFMIIKPSFENTRKYVQRNLTRIKNIQVFTIIPSKQTARAI